MMNCDEHNILVVTRAFSGCLPLVYMGGNALEIRLFVDCPLASHNNNNKFHPGVSAPVIIHSKRNHAAKIFRWRRSAVSFILYDSNENV